MSNRFEQAREEAIKVQNYQQGKAMLNAALKNSDLSSAEQEQIRKEAQQKGMEAGLNAAAVAVQQKRDEQIRQAIAIAAANDAAAYNSSEAAKWLGIDKYAEKKPLPKMPSGLSPEAQQAFLNGGVEWVVANANSLQNQYSQELERQKQEKLKAEQENRARIDDELKNGKGPGLAALALNNDPSHPKKESENILEWIISWFFGGNENVNPAPTVDVSTVQTQVAQSIFAHATQTAQALPTKMPTIMPTFTPTATPYPSITLEPWVVFAKDGLNLRASPSTNASVLAYLPQGATVYANINSKPKIGEDYCWNEVTYTDSTINAKAIAASKQFLNPLNDFIRLTAFRVPIEYYNAMPGDWAYKHVGEDYVPIVGAENPTPLIVASSSGIVAASGKQVGKNGNLQGYGNYVIVEYLKDSLPTSVQNLPDYKDDNSLYAMYAHLLNDVSDALPKGSKVEAGTPLGNMGMSGNGGGINHLHFELRLGNPYIGLEANNGVWYNPTELLPIDPAFIITPNDTQTGWVVQSQWNSQSQCATNEPYIGIP